MKDPSWEDIYKVFAAIVVVVFVVVGYQDITGSDPPRYRNDQVGSWCADGVNVIIDHVGGGDAELNVFKAAAEALHLGECVAVINTHENNP